MEVPVRELKAKLSAYLRRAEAGEVIIVTDRGRPIATLAPLLGGADLDAAVAAGWVRPPTRAGLGPVKRHRASATIAQTLAEDRAE